MHMQHSHQTQLQNLLFPNFISCMNFQNHEGRGAVDSDGEDLGAIMTRITPVHRGRAFLGQGVLRRKINAQHLVAAPMAPKEKNIQGQASHGQMKSARRCPQPPQAYKNAIHPDRSCPARLFRSPPLVAAASFSTSSGEGERERDPRRW